MNWYRYNRERGIKNWDDPKIPEWFRYCDQTKSRDTGLTVVVPEDWDPFRIAGPRRLSASSFTDAESFTPVEFATESYTRVEMIVVYRLAQDTSDIQHVETYTHEKIGFGPEFSIPNNLMYRGRGGHNSRMVVGAYRLFTTFDDENAFPERLNYKSEFLFGLSQLKD